MWSHADRYCISISAFGGSTHTCDVQDLPLQHLNVSVDGTCVFDERKRTIKNHKTTRQQCRRNTCLE